VPIAALNCVGLMKVVTRAVPLRFRVVPEMKPDPVARRVNPGPPAVVEGGEMLVRIGPVVMVKGREGGVGCDPVTLTEATPGFARSEAGTVAVS
jgi:hypothetical protein